VATNYYNYKTKFAEDKRGRRGFLANWWHIFVRDPRWVPPYFPALRHELEPDHNPHIARMDPIFAHTEALPKRAQGDPYQPNQWLQQGWTSAPIYEVPVAASVILKDPRREDGTAYLALLRCVNDPESLDQYFDSLMIEARKKGIRRLIGPTHLSPHLGSGILYNDWDQNPPLYSPYNPPYLPETIRSKMSPLVRAHLFHLAISAPSDPPGQEPAKIVSFDPGQLEDEYLDLMAAACSSWDIYPPPDKIEAAFIYRWIEQWHPFGWLAIVDQRPVGFILVQPDMAPLLKNTGGGRRLVARLWLQMRKRQHVGTGRILFAAVLPDMRGQGIGTQLLRQAYMIAREQNWISLSAGPFPEGSPAEDFLVHHGGLPKQRYWLYQYDI